MRSQVAKNKIHFIGIGGVSMSALAEIAKKAGFEVTGSDIKSGGHSEKNITSDLDLVIYNSAINETSPGYIELNKALEMGIKTVSRGEYLATLVNESKNSIVVSGMHGKTTITTMIGQVLKNVGLNPTVIPGTYVKAFGANYLAGNNDYFVTEGCEYFDNFLHLKPKITVVTNIEEEHLDYFKDLDAIIDSFAKFISNVDKNGALIYFAGDKNIARAIDKATSRPKTMVGYGQFGDQYYKKLDFDLQIPGSHNRLNALAVLAVADYLGIERAKSQATLMNYVGAGRRMQIKGEKQGVLVVDDYGHHPTEITSTISALKEKYPKKRLVVAFWPHQYKRIESLYRRFLDCFAAADEIVLLPIYLVPGRDELSSVSSEKMADDLKKKGKKATAFDDQEEMVEYLAKSLQPNDLLLTIGIPPINQVAEKYLER
jgi:UDP-N-acetylmuramate--alanine ligase